MNKNIKLDLGKLWANKAEPRIHVLEIKSFLLNLNHLELLNVCRIALQIIHFNVVMLSFIDNNKKGLNISFRKTYYIALYSILRM